MSFSTSDGASHSYVHVHGVMVVVVAVSTTSVIPLDELYCRETIYLEGRFIDSIDVLIVLVVTCCHNFFKLQELLTITTVFKIDLRILNVYQYYYFYYATCSMKCYYTFHAPLHT